MTAVQAFTTTGLIGIEVELAVSEYDLQEILSIDNVGYNHEVYDRFVVKHDGSCGSEIVTPPIPAVYKGDDYNTLAGMLQTVNRARRSPINDACSVHVHVGVDVHKPENVEAQLFRLWRLYDYYRRDAVTDWCGPKRDPERSDHAQRYCNRMLATHGRKYGQINATQLFRYLDPYPGEGAMSTVEFRQMHASTDIDRIWQWATFCYLLVNGSRRPSIMRDLAPFTPTDEMRRLMLPKRPKPKPKPSATKALVDGVAQMNASQITADYAAAQPTTYRRVYRDEDVIPVDSVEWNALVAAVQEVSNTIGGYDRQVVQGLRERYPDAPVRYLRYAAQAVRGRSAASHRVLDATTDANMRPVTYEYVWRRLNDRFMRHEAVPVIEQWVTDAHQINRPDAARFTDQWFDQIAPTVTVPDVPDGHPEPIAGRNGRYVTYAEVVDWLTGLTWSDPNDRDRLTNVAEVTQWIRDRYASYVADARRHAIRFVADIHAAEQTLAASAPVESPDPTVPGPFHDRAGRGVPYAEIDEWLTDNWTPDTSWVDVDNRFHVGFDNSAAALSHWRQDQDTLTEGEETDDGIADLSRDLRDYRPDRRGERTNAVQYLAGLRNITVAEALPLVEQWAETYGGITEPTPMPVAEVRPRLTHSIVRTYLNADGYNHQAFGRDEIANRIRYYWPDIAQDTAQDYATTWLRSVPGNEVARELNSQQAEDWTEQDTVDHLRDVFPYMTEPDARHHTTVWRNNNTDDGAVAAPGYTTDQTADILAAYGYDYATAIDVIVNCLSANYEFTEVDATIAASRWADAMPDDVAFEALDELGDDNGTAVNYASALVDMFPCMTYQRAAELGCRYFDAVNGVEPDVPDDTPTVRIAPLRVNWTVATNGNTFNAPDTIDSLQRAADMIRCRTYERIILDDTARDEW